MHCRSCPHKGPPWRPGAVHSHVMGSARLSSSHSWRGAPRPWEVAGRPPTVQTREQPLVQRTVCTGARPASWCRQWFRGCACTVPWAQQACRCARVGGGLSARPQWRPTGPSWLASGRAPQVPWLALDCTLNPVATRCLSVPPTICAALRCCVCYTSFPNTNPTEGRGLLASPPPPCSSCPSPVSGFLAPCHSLPVGVDCLGPRHGRPSGEHSAHLLSP